MLLLSNLDINKFWNPYSCQIKYFLWPFLFLKLLHYFNRGVFPRNTIFSISDDYKQTPYYSLEDGLSLTLSEVCFWYLQWTLGICFLQGWEIEISSPCCGWLQCPYSLGQIDTFPYVPSILTQAFKNSSLSSIHHSLEGGVDDV